jgi:HPt (histidine-containing phosphotransfer) domain-containing protein
MPDSEQEDQLLNLALICELREAIGDQFHTLIPPFVAFVEQSLKDLRRSILDQNCAGLVALAHSLKGSAVCLGARTLADCAGVVEQHARVGDLHAIRATLPELVRISEATIRLLQADLIKP